MRPEQPEAGTTARIYTASKSKHGAMWRRYRDAGEPIISTWIDESEPGQTTDWADLWTRAVREASTCTALIWHRRDGEIHKGAFVEVGAALAHGKPVLYDGPNDLAVLNHPLVIQCSDLIAAFNLARGTVGNPKPGQPEADGEACPECCGKGLRGFGQPGIGKCPDCNGTGKRTPNEPKLDDMTDAECDSELRAIGVDPGEVKVRGRVFADTLKENARLRAEVAAKPADERLREAVERMNQACVSMAECAAYEYTGGSVEVLHRVLPEYKLRELIEAWQLLRAALADTPEPTRDERLREAVGNLLSVLDENLHRGAGHAHWDYTMSHGAGCATCQAQREGRTAIEKARRTVDAALADTGGKDGGK